MALGADVLTGGSDGGSATAAAVSNYVMEVKEKAIECLTDTDKIDAYLSQQAADEFNAHVRSESHWIYWDL